MCVFYFLAWSGLRRKVPGVEPLLRPGGARAGSHRALDALHSALCAGAESGSPARPTRASWSPLTGKAGTIRGASR
jgi:hypothetical protein